MLKVVHDEELAPGVEPARCEGEHADLPVRLELRADGAWEELVECGRCGRWRKLLTVPA